VFDTMAGVWQSPNCQNRKTFNNEGNMNFNLKRNRTVEDAAGDWMDAKNAETKANKDRIAAEQELIDFIGIQLEGGESHQIGPYKVTLTGRLNRKVDWDIISTLGIIEDVLPIKQKPELDLKALRYLQSNEPEIYNTFCKALTIEPAKTSVTVIRTEK